MPRIDRAAYEAAEETSGGGIEQMEPGAYEVVIQAVRTNGKNSEGNWHSDFTRPVADFSVAKSYVVVVWDVAEGPFKGRFSEAYFMKNGQLDPEKDFMHNLYLSYKNLGYLKHLLNGITGSNPGFDALAAFEADQWDQFVGRKFGVVLDGTVRTNAKGYDTWRLDVADVITVQDVRDGNYREPKITDERDDAMPAPKAKPGAPAGGVYDDDVPF